MPIKVEFSEDTGPCDACYPNDKANDNAIFVDISDFNNDDKKHLCLCIKCTKELIKKIKNLKLYENSAPIF